MTDTSALDAAFRGDIRDASRFIAESDPAAPDVGLRARSLAFRSVVSALDPNAHAPPSVDEVAAFRSADSTVRELVARTCAIEELRAFVLFDAATLARWGAARESLHDESPTGLASSALASIRAALGERFVLDADALAVASDRARAARAATSSIQATALLALSEPGSLEAVRAARRGARMSRTEGLLLEEYFANLTLARNRRWSGRSHLAARILSSLSLVVPSYWAGWVAWELAMVGQIRRASRILRMAPESTRAHSAATALLRLLGTPDDTAARDAVARVAGEWAIVRDDALAVLAAVTDGVTNTGVAEIDHWVAGDTDTTPRALHGLVTTDASGRGSNVVVHVSPGVRARRLLRPGVEGTSLLRERPDAYPRAQCVIAVLALAGEDGLPAEELYSRVFGGAYNPALNDGLLRTTVYRARKHLDGDGSIERVGGRIVLDVARPFYVPNPRCASGTVERMLRALAAHARPMSARELADVLEVSVRVVQEILRTLLDEEAIQTQRAGRSVYYFLEDTTFSEPSLHRLAPRTQ